MKPPLERAGEVDGAPEPGADETGAQAAGDTIDRLDIDIPGYAEFTLLARGGEGMVYRARQEAVGRLVAVKVLAANADPDQTEAAAARFRRELEITVRLGRAHPHIVTVLDTRFTAGGRPCIVMDYHDLGSLHDQLQAHGPLPASAVVTAGTVVADALSYAHAQGVLHRDVKPQNILVLPTSYVLADFGLARHVDTERSSSLELFSYRHAAPQVLDGELPTAADDIYSLGSTLFTALDGRPPFAADDPESDTALAYLRRVRTGSPRTIRAAGVPDELRAIIERCLAKRREDRFPDAPSLRAALTAVTTDAHEWVPVALPAPARTSGTSPDPVPAGAGEPSGEPAGAGEPPAGTGSGDPAPGPPDPTTATAAPSDPPPDASPDPSPDASPDASPDPSPDPPPDASPDPSPEASPDPPPDPPPDRAPDPPPPAPAADRAPTGPLRPRPAPSAAAHLGGPSTGRDAPSGLADAEPTGSRPEPDLAQPGQPEPAYRWRRVAAMAGAALLAGAALGGGGVWLGSRQAPSQLPADPAAASADQSEPDPDLAGSVPTGAAAPGRTVDPQIAPEIIALDDRGDSIELDWVDRSQGTALFVVYDVTDPDDPRFVRQTSPGQTSAVIDDLDPVARYCFQVIAVTRGSQAGSPPRCAEDRG